MIKFIDVLVKKVDKICRITKTTHTYEERDSYNNLVRSSSSDTYDSTISTRILFDNGEQLDFEYDIPLVENWVIRYVFDDDLLIYKVCLENSFILFDRTKKNEFQYLFSLEESHDLRQLLFNENLIKKTETIQKYQFTNQTEYSIQYADLTIMKVEKISLLEKDGSSYINTRLYFTDNSSELFTKIDVPALPGWHLRKIFAGYVSLEDLKQTDSFIVENDFRISQADTRVSKENIKNKLSSEFSKTIKSESNGNSLSVFCFLLCFIGFIISGYSYYAPKKPFLGDIRNLSNFSFDKIHTILYPDIIFILIVLLIIITLIMKHYITEKELAINNNILNEFLNSNSETINTIDTDYKRISLTKIN